MTKRKLIEVALPLEAINVQSAREKSIRHGHPSTLHLWWARRPLATARAVLFAQLVDDPSSHSEEYEAEAVRRGEADVEHYVQSRISAERDRLFGLIERMVDWDNLNDTRLFDQVRAEIQKSTDGQPPAIIDPFAGGGTIPLESQRLGLTTFASDLNPVAVLINKALIEFPPIFSGRLPVAPELRGGTINFSSGAEGLSADVNHYGEMLRNIAAEELNTNYPDAILEDGSTAPVIAWIWARNVQCPNPACGVQTPLVRSWWLSKKKGREAFIQAAVHGKTVKYSVKQEVPKDVAFLDDGTISRTGAICISCGSSISLPFIRDAGKRGLIGEELMATVAEGNRQRHYLSVSEAHRESANVERPTDAPNGKLASNTRDFKTPNYGLNNMSDLFTNRQLKSLTTLTGLISEVRNQVFQDALASGLQTGESLEAGGDGAEAYADAISVYLALSISRTTDYSNSLCSWHITGEKITHLFTKQAIPMVWDFAETNIFSSSSGNYLGQVNWIARVIKNLPASKKATVINADAAKVDFSDKLISTDPPYYDNIGYSDLSDYFYIWLRKSLQGTLPQLFSTMLVPKEDELVANPYRHGGKDGAKEFFETGFEKVFENARKTASDDYPIAVYYAFKQSETDSSGQASTGWETILGSMIHAGWVITATWPMRSELSNRMIATDANALASSIVLALRPRPEAAPIIDRGSFIKELRDILPSSLRDLQQGSIAPVDLRQAAIGPGMGIYSKYSKVISPNGEVMPVREALKQINIVLEEVLSELEGDFDSDTRWCISWFEMNGFESGAYGDAETLANAKNATVSGLDHAGVITSRAGKVALIEPGNMPVDYDPRKDDRVSLWEITMHLSRCLSDPALGLAGAGRIYNQAMERGLDVGLCKELSYLLFSVAEKRGWVAVASVFNLLASSWSELRAAAKNEQKAAPMTATAALDFDALGEED